MFSLFLKLKNKYSSITTVQQIQSNIHHAQTTLRTSTTFLLIPSHVRNKGNEYADETVRTEIKKRHQRNRKEIN